MRVDVVATWALLLGLAESGGCGRTLYGMDLNVPPVLLSPVTGGPVNAITAITEAAQAVGIDYQFLQGNSAATPLPSPVDLLFIDTWHVYGHLQRELLLHEPHVLRWIVLHDTEVDRVHGESVRRGLNVPSQSREWGYSPAEIRRGLGPAVDEFLMCNRNRWVLDRHYPNNNGLTVLRRIGLRECGTGSRGGLWVLLMVIHTVLMCMFLCRRAVKEMMVPVR